MNKVIFLVLISGLCLFGEETENLASKHTITPTSTVTIVDYI